MLEQELASAMQLIQGAVPEASPYYWETPQDFRVPAVYFPVPEITSSGDTVSTYRLAYTWYVKFFASTSAQAHELALRALESIRKARNAVPILNEDGTPEGHIFRLQDPQLRLLERGVSQLTIRWNSPRPYTVEEVPAAGEMNFDLKQKPAAEEEPLEQTEAARIRAAQHLIRP